MKGLQTPQVGVENKYQYNGKEMNDVPIAIGIGLGWLDYGARWYDPSLGRFNVIDRFAEKYSVLTPYHYTANNPILFVDVNGDYLDLGDLIKKSQERLNNSNAEDKSKENTDAYKLKQNLEEISGLQLEFKDGLLSIVKGSKVNKKGTSKTARKKLKKIIKDKKTTVVVKDNYGQGNQGGITGNGNEIQFDMKQIDTFKDNLSDDLSPNTMGEGLIFLHEYLHTKHGGLGGWDVNRPNAKPQDEPGPIVTVVNIMRAELGKDKNGKIYGQRVAYMGRRAPKDRDPNYMPFSQETYDLVKQGIRPTKAYMTH